MKTQVALAIAREKGLDLVEVAPTSRPPVCKILDYGQYKYEEKKRKKEAKAKQSKVEIKEMKFRPKTDSHDLDFKTKHVRRFLEEGNKCKLVVQFRGRERAHPEVGEALLVAISESLDDVGEVTSRRPLMEGSRMILMLAPRVGVLRRESTG
jgi:translation initiation factor IF-3